MRGVPRRWFLLRSVESGLGALAAAALWSCSGRAAEEPETNMRFGLVTYQWAKDWDLPTLLRNCAKTGVLGVELRTTHAHRVEPNLTAAQRDEVRKQFEDSPVTFVGIGSDERFDSPDPAKLAKAIEATKAFVQLSHDIGGSGVKVKPNDFHKDVAREQTIEQIGKALNTVGEFAAGFGQQIRLEVHGQCAPLPIIKQIMDIADNPNVAVCWNSNPTDLDGGLERNFNLVKDRLGQTLHIHTLDSGQYPYEELFKLLVNADYAGWLLLEEGKVPEDPVAALAKQRRLFDEMLAKAARRAK